MQAVRAFRVVAVAEGISWLALILATIVKYTAEHPIGVKILGPIHGALFMAYVILALVVRRQLRWDAKTTLIVLVDSVLPGGGLVVARRTDLKPVAA